MHCLFLCCVADCWRWSLTLQAFPQLPSCTQTLIYCSTLWWEGCRQERQLIKSLCTAVICRLVHPVHLWFCFTDLTPLGAFRVCVFFFFFFFFVCVCFFVFFWGGHLFSEWPFVFLGIGFVAQVLFHVRVFCAYKSYRVVVFIVCFLYWICKCSFFEFSLVSVINILISKFDTLIYHCDQCHSC